MKFFIGEVTEMLLPFYFVGNKKIRGGVELNLLTPLSIINQLTLLLKEWNTFFWV